MTALHRPSEVFSSRHVPSWLLLCFASGCTNATALLACERYVTHLTGTVTRLGMDVGEIGLLCDFALVVASFVAGAMLSSYLINARAFRGKRPLHTAPLLVVAGTTAAVAIFGRFGWLGPFGGAVDEAGDFVLLAGLSFASGLQNAAVATSTGLLIRTTHLTGPATDLGIHLVEVICMTGEARTMAARHASLRAGKLVAFALGAAAGAALAARAEYLAFLVPATLVLAATLISFVPFERRAARAAAAPPPPADAPPAPSSTGEGHALSG